MKHKILKIRNTKYKILEENLRAIEKVEERLSRRREPSTVERYKEHLLDFFGRVNSDVLYTGISFDHIDKFWRWKKQENEKRRKDPSGKGMGRITEKYSKQYINLITSILTTFFNINNLSNFAEQIRVQERQTVYWKPMKLDAKLVERLRERGVVVKGYEIHNPERKNLQEFFVERSCLLIELLISTGVRISEAQNLKIEDTKLDVKNPHIVVTKAKRGFTRKVRVSKRFVEQFDRFMRLRKDSNPHVFCNTSGGALNVGTLKSLFRMATSALSEPDEFGNRKTFGAHMLRHLYATYCVDLYPLRLCRYNLGHVSIDTTSKYLDKTKELLDYESPIDKRKKT